MPSSPPRIGNVGERGECIPCLHATLFRPPIPFFLSFSFLFAYQTYQQQYVAALLPIGSSLSLTDTHTYLYLYLETRADTVRRLLVLGFVFYKEYGSFVEKILGGVV